MVQSTVSACIAEVVACVIRVPCEVVKQRTQNQPSHSVSTVFLQTLRSEYITIEWNRKSIRSSDVTDLTLIQLKAWQSAMCGCLAGTIAGALTTPLDVAKTRIMLAEPNSNFASGHIIYAIRTIFQENGIRGTIWIFTNVLPSAINLPYSVPQKSSKSLQMNEAVPENIDVGYL
ncbi:S-adenosylmethionine mitochondrial carrier protein [Schistosoma japonicum]|nr:S-adenosylmethionine mitochondrial carrier protein [Schistosoma japonicum]